MAVAFDTSALSTATTSQLHGTNHTLAYTMSSAVGGVLFVSAFSSNSSGASIFDSVAYNGVAMSRMAFRVNGGSIEVWYLNNPASGTHNIVGVVSSDQSNKLQICGSSYTGSAGFSGNEVDSQVTSVSSISKTLDTLVDNSWVGYAVMNIGGPPANTAGGVDRQSFQFNVVGDNNTAKTPVGTVTEAFSGSNNSWAWVLWEIDAIVTRTPSVSDTVTITENVAVRVIDRPSVSDTVSLVESITMRVMYRPQVNDTVTVAENVAIQVPVRMSVFDTVTITENITVVRRLVFSVFDTVTITEFWITNKNFGVVDTVTITENISLFLSHRNPSTSDAVTVAESVSMFIPMLYLSASDLVIVGELVDSSAMPRFQMPLSKPRGSGRMPILQGLSNGPGSMLTGGGL